MQTALKLNQVLAKDLQHLISDEEKEHLNKITSKGISAEYGAATDGAIDCILAETYEGNLNLLMSNLMQNQFNLIDF